MNFSDRLAETIRKKGAPLCVGLDPRWENIPLAIRKKHGPRTPEGEAAAYGEFCQEALELVVPFVGVVKPQSAFFENCGPEGMKVLQSLLGHARALGLITILDNKRNDIASTGQAYAEAVFGRELDGKKYAAWPADAMTINPYLGADAVEPFLDSARKADGGIFLLVRTSNPGARLFQDLDCSGKPLYFRVAEAVAKWNEGHIGACGLGDAGMVVGATYPSEAAELRQAFPHVWFLVPGFGAQGGGVEEVRPAFRADGLGAIVNSSRGILFPTKPEDVNWKQAVVEAARSAASQLGSLLKGQ
ncbi:MAG: orotidine-5'-phosphate decarboxylase [Gemmataceae bacterium]|nr:orotidine-5'-phosphate decarboxylase [Gemmataceae bacterium]